MPFLKGLFRAATFSAGKQILQSVDVQLGPREQSQELSSRSPGAQTAPGLPEQGRDIEDQDVFYPPAPAFYGSFWSRSYSEGTIMTSSPESSPWSATLTPLSLSLPSSPLTSEIFMGNGRLARSSAVSLPPPKELENWGNKKMQKKASSPNLNYGHRSPDMDFANTEKKRMAKPPRRSTFPLLGTAQGTPELGSENGNGSKRRGSGYVSDDDSMDFKCCGLPESGTFSKLTVAEAAIRVEDELAMEAKLS